MTISLITGANKGLGFETARRLAGAGHTVYVGARDSSRGQSAAQSIGARFVQLDVTDQESVDAAARAIEQAEGHLDVLVNNAGIGGPYRPAPEIGGTEMRDVFETNVFGVVRVTQAFIPLLERSANPVIVNVGSSIGSKALVMNPDRIESTLPVLAYGASKAALVMVTLQYAKALPSFKINIVEPGFTATDFNAHRGPQTVEEGAEIIVRMANLDRSGPTATFQDRHGTLPW
ncbi:MAG: SDR family NAD(P)-dependent oxidoreductase [Pseudolysinimonas sp.]|uniref:SDR family NAD(P)-dependent oxidoreductase n=1 Tax=Pseudolysinimonas sp. TaxID=2680009 RepID=UPI003266ABA9